MVQRDLGFGSCFTVSVNTFTLNICAPHRKTIVGLFSLVAGTISLLTQVLLYVWLEESNSVKITVSCIALFTVLPLLHLVPYPWPSKKKHQSTPSS